MSYFILSLIRSALFSLAVISVAYLIYLMISSICDYFIVKANRDNHYLKKMVKAQNVVIAKLCNSLHR